MGAWPANTQMSGSRNSESGPVAHNPSVVSEEPEALLKYRLLGSPRISSLVDLGWESASCICTEFPRDALAASPGTTLGFIRPSLGPQLLHLPSHVF